MKLFVINQYKTDIYFCSDMFNNIKNNDIIVGNIL